MSRKVKEFQSEEYFSIHAHKNDLARLVDKFGSILEDVADFWKFVQKYEDVERKKKSTVPSRCLSPKPGGTAMFKSFY